MQTVKEKMRRGKKFSKLETRVKNADNYKQCFIYTDSQVALQKISKCIDYVSHCTRTAKRTQ